MPAGFLDGIRMSGVVGGVEHTRSKQKPAISIGYLGVWWSRGDLNP